MPPVAAAVLPHPPLLVPGLAGAAATELDPLRDACQVALSTVLAAADVTVVVGDGPVWGVPEPAAAGSFQPYGGDVEVALPALVDLDLRDLPPPARLAHLPLSLAVAAHLLAGLDPPPVRLAAVTVPGSLGRGAAATIGRSLTAAAQDAGTAGPGAASGRSLTAAAQDVGTAGPGAASGRSLPAATRDAATAGPGAASGRTLAAAPAPATGPGSVAGPRPAAGGAGGRGAPGGRVGLVVMGDLSACRTERAPGAFREDAAGFDGSVAEAFRTGHPERLLDLDPVKAADLLVAGRVPLQVLAGAFEGDPARPTHVADSGDPAPTHVADSGDPSLPGQVPTGGAPSVRGQVLYDEAPYGVGYLVALLVAP